MPDVQPHDDLAEQSTLGGMLLMRDAAVEVLGILQADDFYQPKHGVVFDAIRTLIGRGEPADAITVSQELSRTGFTQKAGGVAYLHELIGMVPTAANSGYYAQIVHDKAILRRLIQVGEKITKSAYEGEGNPVVLFEEARATIDNAGRGMVDVLGDYNEEIASWLAAKQKPIRQVTSPWSEINSFIGGFVPGRMYVIGARPSEGKTMMGLQIADKLATSGSVAFVSLEMTSEELNDRRAAMRADIPLWRLSEHKLDEDVRARLKSALSDIRRYPIRYGTRAFTMAQIASFARTVSRTAPLAGVVVDYVQLVSGDHRRSRYEQATEVSRQLKLLAHSLDAPVIAISQLNRESVSGGKRRAPTAADLRETGGLEQDADVILLLQRRLEDDGTPADLLDVHIVKNRHGNTGRKTLRMDGRHQRLSSIQYGVSRFPEGRAA